MTQNYCELYVLEYLAAIYAICSSKNCSSDFNIITNNDMFDNTSNVITIKRGFYLQLQSYGGSFVFLFPRWMNETFGNLTDITLVDAFGYVQLNMIGKLFHKDNDVYGFIQYSLNENCTI